MQNQRIPKQTALATMVGTKRRKSLTTRRSEAEEELNKMGGGGKKQAGNGQRLLGMKEDCPGSQGPTGL
jgi:hypothetical protein